MLYFYALCIFSVILQVHCVDFERLLEGLDHVNAVCRDNNDVPVDWWYIYKPPQHTGPYFESGLNFTYISSNRLGRFKASSTYLNYNSMLQFTLAPLYKKLHQSELAVMAYGYPPPTKNRAGNNIPTSTALGLLFGNNKGGVWITHTIPHFPDLNKYPPFISEEAFVKGHMIMCLNVDKDILNLIAPVVGHTNPHIYKYSVPESLKSTLPAWEQMKTGDFGSENESKIKKLSFITRSKTVQAMVLSRAPGDGRCLYEIFARRQEIVVDLYGSSPIKRLPICEDAYSLRYIDSISLKIPEHNVYYINNATDKATFGVSTAATWQRKGQNPSPQYWTCVGNVDHIQTGSLKGGLIICIEFYNIWIAFDNLKVKEPSC